MANWQNSNERLFGGAVVLEVADGCPDVKPLKASGALLLVRQRLRLQPELGYL
jgi:hypothetical protein